jgi:phosphate/sulfate permease
VARGKPLMAMCLSFMVYMILRRFWFAEHDKTPHLFKKGTDVYASDELQGPSKHSEFSGCTMGAT